MPDHTQYCEDSAFVFHAATGDYAQCVCQERHLSLRISRWQASLLIAETLQLLHEAAPGWLQEKLADVSRTAEELLTVEWWNENDQVGCPVGTILGRNLLPGDNSAYREFGLAFCDTVLRRFPKTCPNRLVIV